MNVFFIVSIVCVVLGLAALTFNYFKSKSNMTDFLYYVVFGFTVAAAILALVGVAVKDHNYKVETVEMCNAKHGVVSTDQHCFVDGKPVEFGPGVWKR